MLTQRLEAAIRELPAVHSDVRTVLSTSIRQLSRRRITPATREMCRELVATFAFSSMIPRREIDTSAPDFRTKANAMVAYCFRNQGPFEDHHGSGKPMLNAV